MSPRPRPPLGWLAAGVAVQAAFAGFVPLLYVFLLTGASRPPAGPTTPLDALVDLLLVLGFAVPHSVLLTPPVRRRLTRIVPPPVYGSLFTLGTVIALGLLIGLWRPLPGVVWTTTGTARLVLIGANAVAWASFLYAMALQGLGEQTGLTPLWHALRGRTPPRRAFAPRGLQRVFRHPIYLTFLGIAWTPPTMSTAHLLLALGFTAYTVVGSLRKDARMLQYVGEPYRRYMAEVPGYPLLRGGPLGRVPTEASPPR